MSKFIFFILIFIILIICVLIIKNLFLQIKRKGFELSKNILKLLILIVFIAYGLWAFHGYLLLVKVENFGSEISALLSGYKTIYGKYPINISELKNYEEYKEKKHYLMWPLTHEFGLIGIEDEDGYKYTFYAYGLDDDDDKLAKIYDINFIYAFFPFKDGDIILDKDKIKEIKLWEEFNKSKN